MHTVFLGIGSNIQPEENIRRAAAEIASECRILAFSSHIITPPLNNRQEAHYINAVWKIETELAETTLKEYLRRIEYLLGRRRSEDRYAAREIDLDILVFDGKIVDDTVRRRDFVYGPLLEIEPRIKINGLENTLKKSLGFKGKYRLSGLKAVLEKEYLNGPEKS